MMNKFLAVLVFCVCTIAVSEAQCGCSGGGGIGGSGGIGSAGGLGGRPYGGFVGYPCRVIKQKGSGFIGNKVKNCIGDIDRLTYPEEGGCCGDSGSSCCS